jgi:hypothetical protein
MSQIGRLSGLHEILIKPRKRTRSLNQNSYYWVAVVTPFAEWLRENYGDSAIDKDQAHDMLKVKILGSNRWTLPNSTGESVIIIPQSKRLSVEEFEEYIEKCCAWLSEFCGILIVPCEEFYERPE